MARKEKQTFDTEDEIFATRLRELMSERGTTQAQLAEALEVRRQTVSLYMNGQSNPDWKMVAAIARYFGVTADYMVGLEDVRNHRYAGAQEETGLSEKALQALAVAQNRFIDGGIIREMDAKDVVAAVVKIDGALLPLSYPAKEIVDYLFSSGFLTTLVKVATEMMDYVFYNDLLGVVNSEITNVSMDEAVGLVQTVQWIMSKGILTRWSAEEHLKKSLMELSEKYIEEKRFRNELTPFRLENVGDNSQLYAFTKDTAMKYLKSQREFIAGSFILSQMYGDLIERAGEVAKDKDAFFKQLSQWDISVVRGKKTEDEYVNWLLYIVEGGDPNAET